MSAYSLLTLALVATCAHGANHSSWMKDSLTETACLAIPNEACTWTANTASEHSAGCKFGDPSTNTAMGADYGDFNTAALKCVSRTAVDSADCLSEGTNQCVYNANTTDCEFNMNATQNAAADNDVVEPFITYAMVSAKATLLCGSQSLLTSDGGTECNAAYSEGARAAQSDDNTRCQLKNGACKTVGANVLLAKSVMMAAGPPSVLCSKPDTVRRCAYESCNLDMMTVGNMGVAEFADFDLLNFTDAAALASERPEQRALQVCLCTHCKAALAAEGVTAFVDTCPVDCVGAWGEFATCSKTCGNGTQARTYTQSTTAVGGGAACAVAAGASESQACGTDACPTTPDGLNGAAHRGPSVAAAIAAMAAFLS